MSKKKKKKRKATLPIAPAVLAAATPEGTSGLAPEPRSTPSGDRGSLAELYERCPNCRNRTGFLPEKLPVKPSCPSCGYVFAVVEADNPSSEAELVLVGARVEAASGSRETARPQVGGPRDRTVPATSPKVSSPPYDPGFREAVEAGRLTPRQAADRGERMRWALKLVKKHQLSMDLALSVADNKTTIGEVLRKPDRKPRPAKSKTLPVRSDRPSRFPTMMGLLVGLWLVVAVIAGRANPQAQNTTPAPPVAAVGAAATVAPKTQSVQSNESGHVTAVIAADPQTVLDLFCKSTSIIGTRTPVKIIPATTNWLGIFSEAETHYSIGIHQDPVTGKFTAGDGRVPIQPERWTAL